jgi:polysaccharide biosynthesis transport protein
MKTDETLQLPKIHSMSSLTAEPEELLDLGSVLRSLARTWWIITAITIVMTTLAGVKVLRATPSYEGKFEFQVQSGSAETEVIANIPETLTSEKALTEPNAVDEDLLRIRLSPKTLQPVVEAAKTSYPQLCPMPAGLASDDPKSFDNYCYQKIVSQLSIQALEDPLDESSSIVEVLYRDVDPENIQIVLKIVSQAYLDYSLASKQVDIRRGIEFVEEKLPELNDKVNSLQGQLQDLRIANNIIEPISRAGELSSQITAFTEQKIEAEIELERIRSTSNDLRQQLSGLQEQAASSALAQNPRYQAILNSLLELDTQIAADATLYLDSAPNMQILKEQRQNLLTLLEREGQQSQREISSQIREMQSREKSLQQTLQDLNTDINKLSSIARNYDDIQRELEIATENLNQFLAKREALQIDAAQREIPWELITPPTLPQLVSKNLPMSLLLGGAVGLLIGIGIALLLDHSSGVIHSEEDVKRSTRLPVLGSIPAYERTTAVVTATHSVRSSQYESTNGGFERNGTVPQSSLDESNSTRRYVSDPFSESFRSLYTNLRLLSTDKPIRSISVSSVMAGEGKSTVAMHLAEAAAATGQRVLLVDADLRRPQLHNYLELSNEKGLTDLFSGQANPAVIQKFSPEPNLYVITAGSVPFEPTRLFSSRSMRQFTEQVASKFDLLIYDTPPLLGQSDAYLVANYTDGLLLVTRTGKLKQPLLERAMEQLRISDIKVLGVVTREG